MDGEREGHQGQVTRNRDGQWATGNSKGQQATAMGDRCENGSGDEVGGALGRQQWQGQGQRQQQQRH